MEIKLTEKQKTILEGVIRTSVFLIVMRKLYIFFAFDVTVPIFIAIVALLDATLDFIIPQSISEDFFDILLLFLMNSSVLFNTYIIAKLCGLFKYFAKFKFWKSFLMLLIISTMLYYLCIIKIVKFKMHFNVTHMRIIAYTIIPSYLVYLFFNYLTKKFPKPFEKIGYFFSIEFYINLFRKIVNKFKRCK